ncbi:Heterocyst differentiation ATP-binding protein HepA [Marinomonas aquimarina]|uniref:Heterocyst differentiation ATP-binding protein HepA n=1 Tax=Marinomonas aquimarina TaxID=295068 RepID=A0A1A8T8C3_9GAMM|nr:ATP-binding cassette domain-containing protein [Marinomonas aquimarina]SBS28612.1 Heterocyst differentiation ATP-binding protein HepA [Marinomonas aquimarina]
MSKRKPPLLTFKSLLLENPFGLLVATLIGIVASLAAVALLGISGWFLSAAGLAAASGAALSFNYFTPGALVRLMAILRTAGRYGEQVFSHDHLLGLLRSLRLWIWDQRVKTPLNSVYRQTRGDLLQRLVGDLDMIIKWPLAVIMPWLYGLLGCLALLALASFVEWQLAAPVLVYSVLQLGLVLWLANRKALPSVYRMQALSVHRRSRFMSVFSALITLTIRGHWQHYSDRLAVLDTRQKTLQQGLQRVISMQKLISQGLSGALIVAVLALCLVWTEQGVVLAAEVEATWLVALVLAVLGVNELMQPLANSVLSQGQSKVGLKRLNQLAVNQPTDTLEFGPLPSAETLELRKFVGFHDHLSLLHLPKLSLQIQAGQRLRLTGPSGVGKSTCLAALAGDLPYRGEVLLNGHCVSLTDHPKWRSQIAYLAQQSVIFQQSLASNLRLGNRQASDEQLWEILQLLGLKEWAEALPNGLDTLLGAQGRDISGGQARRICLARVMLRGAQVMILDEPFDGLDSTSIQRICDALERYTFRPKLLIYVSHIDTPLDLQSRHLELI